MAEPGRLKGETSLGGKSDFNPGFLFFQSEVFQTVLTFTVRVVVSVAVRYSV